MVENPWMKAARLEQELASMTRRCEQADKAYEYVAKEMKKYMDWVSEVEEEAAHLSGLAWLFGIGFLLVSACMIVKLFQ